MASKVAIYGTIPMKIFFYEKRVKRFQTVLNRAKQRQTGSHRAKWGQTGSNEAKWGQTWANLAKWCQMGPSRVKWGNHPWVGEKPSMGWQVTLQGFQVSRKLPSVG